VLAQHIIDLFAYASASIGERAEDGIALFFMSAPSLSPIRTEELN
jgi:hypothetical protein